MESQEAIMENENNSNVETESHIRDQQGVEGNNLEQIRPVAGEGIQLNIQEQDTDFGSGVNPVTSENVDTKEYSYESANMHSEQLETAQSTGVAGDKSEILSVTNHEEPNNEDIAMDSSHVSATSGVDIPDYEDFVGEQHTSHLECTIPTVECESNQLVNLNDAENQERISRDLEEKAEIRLSVEPMEEEDFNLEQVDSSFEKGKEQVDNPTQQVDNSMHMDVDNSTVTQVNKDCVNETNLSACSEKEPDAHTVVNEEDSNNIKSSGGENFWEDDVDLLGDENQDINSSSKDKDENIADSVSRNEDVAEANIETNATSHGEDPLVKEETHSSSQSMTVPEEPSSYSSKEISGDVDVEEATLDSSASCQLESDNIESNTGDENRVAAENNENSESSVYISNDEHIDSITDVVDSNVQDTSHLQNDTGHEIIMGDTSSESVSEAINLEKASDQDITERAEIREMKNSFDVPPVEESESLSLPDMQTGPDNVYGGAEQLGNIEQPDGVSQIEKSEEEERTRQKEESPAERHETKVDTSEHVEAYEEEQVGGKNENSVTVMNEEKDIVAVEGPTVEECQDESVQQHPEFLPESENTPTDDIPKLEDKINELIEPATEAKLPTNELSNDATRVSVEDEPMDELLQNAEKSQEEEMRDIASDTEVVKTNETEAAKVSEMSHQEENLGSSLTKHAVSEPDLTFKAAPENMETKSETQPESSVDEGMMEKISDEVNEAEELDSDVTSVSEVEKSANDIPSEPTESIDRGDNNRNDVIEIGHIKSEVSSTDEADDAKSVMDDSKSESLSGENIKQEQDADKSMEEEIVVLDDEGEVVKQESEGSKAEENGLGIQISAVSGNQQQLHANAEQSPSNPTSTANHKTETPKIKSSKSKTQTCLVCSKVTKCKYNIVRNGDTRHLCDDACFKQFRKSPSQYLKGKDENKMASRPQALGNAAVQEALFANKLQAVTKQEGYKTCAVCQLMNFNTQHPFCNWKGLDFCGESCLGKFQGNLNTSCSFCHAYIPIDMRATFCLKIGNDMRPFCKQRCYTEFKKRLRLCAFCQRDLAGVPTAFTAMVGSDGKFREFCSQPCLKKMENQVNDVEVLSVDKGNLKQETITCSLCETEGGMKHSVIFQGKINKLCSDLCLSAFQNTNKLNLSKCDSCKNICTAEEAQAHFVQFEGQLKRFCSDQCVNQFRKSNSKVMRCGWCATKKLNFDMIERLDADNKFQMFCSLNCLSLYRVNLQAKSNQAVACDQCKKVVPAQYHLTMSDASVRNFCSYTCVMTFQSQFTKFPSQAYGGSTTPTLSQSGQTQPAGVANLPQKVPGPKGRGRMSTRKGSAKDQSPSFPVISSVMSLAPQGRDQNLTIPSATMPAPVGTASNLVPSGDGKQQILIQPAVPKAGKNKSLQCRPLTQTKATSCRPHSQSKEVQTDEVPAKSVCVPIPVPIYIPMPCVMYTAPTPRMVPFPLPIPVPIFIPTTRKSANGISKAIKEIVERMPSDPLEAELLMMAEAVASDKGPGDSDSDSEAEAAAEDFGVTEDESVRATPREDENMLMRKRDGQGEEDMIQMALRMAEEMSGPVEDLESSVEPVAVNTEPPRQQQPMHYEHQMEDEYTPSRSGRGRGAKRASRGRPPASRAKRPRTDASYSEEDSVQSEPTVTRQSMEPPPDSNYRLKFTYGVNAWRHWVISKNAQLEKTKQAAGSYRVRLFPTDILKCTTDELNYTLCMFIKEVRKPNSEEYSPDSIYYLCLGIQQYLYENGRIDNIFTDMYFEKFTDSLHQILKTHQPKVNPQGQMLCRIEEEHLWESKQLGAHSPFVLLNTLIYFHTKHFILKTAQEHMSLSFAQILKHWKKGMPVKGQSASSSKNVSLRFYCLANGKKDGLAARKNKEGVPVYEVTENFDNPLRCPVKLYEFFLSKCPESIKNRNDIFYPVPERSCVPDSPVWYSTQSIDIHTMDKMLTRVLLVREIQEAHLHAQPIYL